MDSLCLQLQPYSPWHLLALIEGSEEFGRSFGLRAADGLRAFIVSEEVPPDFLMQLRDAKEADPWLHGFAIIDAKSKLVIGNAGFKGPPVDETVEIAYGIVPSFEGHGFATEATRQLISFASNDREVSLIRAHTLPTTNASTRVLIKNGFVKVGEIVDPHDGPVWRWERTTSRPQEQKAS